LTPDPSPTILCHGTTLKRALAIDANGPDAYFREPGTGQGPPAKGFSTVIKGRPCQFGEPETAARNKDGLFPREGGPAILEVDVPAEIMAILYADSIAAGLAKASEIKFEAESGLNELRAAWPNLAKRVFRL
jgi:hypothetical protein